MNRPGYLDLTVIDFLAVAVQLFLHGNLQYKMNQLKYSLPKSLILSTILFSINYFLAIYVVKIAAARAVLYFTIQAIHSLIVFGEGFWYRMRRVMVLYLIYIGLDFACILIFPWIPITFAEDVNLSSKVILGKNLYNILSYFLIVVVELFSDRKESSHLGIVSVFAASFALCQIVMVYLLFCTDSKKVMENIGMLTVFCSGIVIMGHLVTMELFRQIMRQGKKQNELEAQMLEQQNQYNYYLLAYRQGEQIRDLRHDMRNQLQAIHCLLKTNGEGDKERAKKMLAQLEKKVGNTDADHSL